MCGIVGATAQRNVAPILLEGLSRLEYRGYDSAGICTINNQAFNCLKTTEKVASLKEKVKTFSCLGSLGIAHTRWATHGIPSEKNAHPHIHENLAIVHNGIIENFKELKSQLENSGYSFKSDTDTEVLLCLIHSHQKDSKNLHEALIKALKEVIGSYAIALINLNEPNTLYTARRGSPLVIGLGIGENFIASDILALLPVTRNFIYLDENENAIITPESIDIFDLSLNKIQKKPIEAELDAESISKGHYDHFMQKEIYEQPTSIRNTLEGRIIDGEISLNTIIGLKKDSFKDIDNIQIVACGTSYHAGLVGKYWLEELTKTSCNVDIASEYRYRKAIVRKNSLFVTISQSGETADTLASLRLAKMQGYKNTLCICNVNASSLVRESDFALLTRAGAEIGVASTKAFTTQLLSILLLSLLIAKQKNSIDKNKNTETIAAIKNLPYLCEKFLSSDKI